MFLLSCCQNRKRKRVSLRRCHHVNKRDSLNPRPFARAQKIALLLQLESRTRTQPLASHCRRCALDDDPHLFFLAFLSFLFFLYERKPFTSVCVSLSLFCATSVSFILSLLLFPFLRFPPSCCLIPFCLVFRNNGSHESRTRDSPFHALAQSFLMPSSLGSWARSNRQRAAAHIR